MKSTKILYFPTNRCGEPMGQTSVANKYRKQVPQTSAANHWSKPLEQTTGANPRFAPQTNKA
jgi:hypothetical protein